jgi:NitT/TauT family transport system permease protein
MPGKAMSSETLPSKTLPSKTPQSEALRNIVPPIVLALFLILCWQGLHLATASGAISSPAATLARLVVLMGSGRFWLDVVETGTAFAWALVLSIVLGIGLGVVLALLRPVGEVMEPILVTFYSLPKVTLYPLVLLIFGLGMPAKVAFGIMHGLVPITLLTRNAITQLKPVYLRTAKVMRLGAFEAVRFVVLPAIIPELVAGIRIGFSLSLLGVLIGEMFASKRGLGFTAVNAMGLGDLDTIMAIGVFLALFAVLANGGLLSLERRIRHRSAGR